MRGEIQAVRQAGELIVMREVIEVLLLLEQLILDLRAQGDVVRAQREEPASLGLERD